MMKTKSSSSSVKKKLATVYLAVGSNLGNRRQYLEQARELLKENNITFLQGTPVLETKPIGGPGQDLYLNVIWKVETHLSAPDLMKALLAIEKQAGRVRTVKNGPRTLDLDILFYDRLIIDTDDLIIPHPRLHEREFILKLMSLIAPDLEHPVFKKTMLDLFSDLKDENCTNFASA